MMKPLSVLADENAAYPRTVVGDLTGVEFPVSLDIFLEMGPAFLTDALRATGALQADNAVVGITHAAEFFGGGMGRKLAFEVCYHRPPAALGTQLFAKFTREFGDPLREIHAPPMETEVRFALLSRQPDFPVRVPVCAFADYSAAQKTGLLITERIPYGERGIESAIDKCLDYLLDDPLEYYATLTKSLAALAARGRSGDFGAIIAREFPHDPQAVLAKPMIPFDEAGLVEMLDALEVFAEAAPHLLPAHVRDPTFLSAFRPAAQMVLAKEHSLRAYLEAQTDMVALSHWNMNLDNAWFWRDSEGTLQCGLLDWGGVGQMNLATAFFGMTCVAESDFVIAHEEALVEILFGEIRRLSGISIDRERFDVSRKISIALGGVAFFLNTPALILAEIPDISIVEDRYDPQIRDRLMPRCQLQAMTEFLNSWQRLDIGATVAAI
jgi:hypothetical protein